MQLELTQDPAMQVLPDAQAVPHAPQLAGSVWVSTQVLLQFFSLGEQPH